MTSFAVNLSRIRSVLGLTQKEIADLIGVSPQAVSRWERGVGDTTSGTVETIAKRLRIPVGALLDEDGPARYLTATGAVIAREDRTSYGTKHPSAPLYGRIAAGVPMEMIPVDDRLWVDPDVRKEHPGAYYLQMRGASMNRVLPDGVYALVDPTASIMDGDVLAVRVDGHDAMVKRVFRGPDSITLAPDSYDPRFEEVRLEHPATTEVEVLGRVVWWVPPHGKRL